MNPLQTTTITTLPERANRPALWWFAAITVTILVAAVVNTIPAATLIVADMLTPVLIAMFFIVSSVPLTILPTISKSQSGARKFGPSLKEVPS